jgi:hypothetical protein
MMLNNVCIIDRASGRLILERKSNNIIVNPDLFSSLISAIHTFTTAIHMGELTSFNTHSKTILLSVTDSLIIVLIMDRGDSSEKWVGTAYKIAREFESQFKLTNWNGNRNTFARFEPKLNAILNA